MSRQVNCPTCKKPTIFGPENPHRPFCSERCQLIDLGDWADEKFRVPVTNVTPDLENNEEDEIQE